MLSIVLTSVLTAGSEQVWEHASRFAGVNEELWPVHMSGGKGLHFTRDTPLGRVLVRSLITLLWVMPLDLHTLVLEEVWPGRGFREVSHSLLQRRWIHTRTIEVRSPNQCVLCDELQFAPRLLPSITARIVRWLFVRRHRLLRAKFGTPA